jgi:hypothetical protein
VHALSVSPLVLSCLCYPSLLLPFSACDRNLHLSCGSWHLRLSHVTLQEQAQSAAICCALTTLRTTPPAAH